MAAYLLVTIKAREGDDFSWLERYTANVPAIVHKHGGEYFLVSETIKRYEGVGPDPDRIILFTFPSIEAIDAFLFDPDYLPFKEARQAGSTADFFGFTTGG